MLKFEDGSNFDPKKFAKQLEAEVVKVAMRELEIRVRGAAASIVDPETGKHADVFIRKKDATNLIICTRGSPAFARELERRLAVGVGTIESRGVDAMSDTPRLYLAHASEDHDTLAKPLAERMIANGIDVWFDEWEIRTGDGLKRKMEEGLQDCTHFLVLLTPNSIPKPWVQSEIDVGFIRLIGGKSRFLGIRVGVEINDLSPFLQTLRCPEVDFTDSGQVDWLIADVHGVSRKPPIGPTPKYARTVPESLGSWSKSAVAVAEFLVRNSKLGRKFDPQTTVGDLSQALGMPEEDVRLAFLDLSDAGLVEKSKEIGSQRYWPNTSLFVEFDKHFLDFDNEKDAIVLANRLVGENVSMSKIEDVAKQFADWPPRRLNSALNYLEGAGVIDAITTLNSGPWVMFKLRVTDRTRRFVRDHG